MTDLEGRRHKGRFWCGFGNDGNGGRGDGEGGRGGGEGVEVE